MMFKPIKFWIDLIDTLDSNRLNAMALSILRPFDTNGCILKISMAKITFSCVYARVRAYVRTNLIDVDLRESTRLRFLK